MIGSQFGSATTAKWYRCQDDCHDVRPRPARPLIGEPAGPAHTDAATTQCLTRRNSTNRRLYARLRSPGPITFRDTRFAELQILIAGIGRFLSVAGSLQMSGT